jgi:hypothetical protein
LIAVNVGPEDFRRHFGILSDAALLATRKENLVESAQKCYDEELVRRGLNSEAPAAAGIASVDEGSEQAGSGDEPVSIATFTVAEEASLARGLLQSASIPSHLANEYAGLGGFQLRLMVPAAFVEQALEILGAEISEDELAAQAEAAATPDVDFDADRDEHL